MSPKNIHLIFALLSCLWVSYGIMDQKSTFPEYVVNIGVPQFYDNPTSLIKGIPKKIIIENVSGNIDNVKISWRYPVVDGTVFQLNRSHRLADLFEVKTPTQIDDDFVCSKWKNDLTTLLTMSKV